MARTFADMQIEVLERLGVDDVRSANRVRRWLNDANNKLNNEERWDYLFGSTTGTMPLTIADMDEVETVTDVPDFNPLVQIDRQSLVEDMADLTTTGTAAYWYKTAPTTLAVYPVDTSTFTVKYIKFSAEMALAADEPLVADRFRSAIVERACATGLRYKGDWDGYRACMAEYDATVQQMRGSMRLPPARQARTHYAVDD